MICSRKACKSNRAVCIHQDSGQSYCIRCARGINELNEINLVKIPIGLYSYIWCGGENTKYRKVHFYDIRNSDFGLRILIKTNLGMIWIGTFPEYVTVNSHYQWC